MGHKHHNCKRHGEHHNHGHHEHGHHGHHHGHEHGHNHHGHSYHNHDNCVKGEYVCKPIDMSSVVDISVTDNNVNIVEIAGVIHQCYPCH